MKKILSIMLISICTIIIITGCNEKSFNKKNKVHKSKDSQEIIKIMENVYIDYINDIYLDSSKYIGKTIEIEGMFTKSKDKDNKNNLYVYRLTDVIENAHSHEEESSEYEKKDNNKIEVMCGLEFYYKGNLPKENDWIKVVGKLEEQDGILFINADSVKIMKDRGMEKVKQFY